jgi:hypothetical protein
VLVQRPAQRDVQDLQPATDRERRHLPFDRGAHECRFGLVGGAIDAVDVGVALLAVHRRIHIGTTTQHDRVDPIEQGREIAGWIDHDRLPTGADDGVEVGARKCRGAGVRPLLALPEATSGDRNERRRRRHRVHR